MGVGRYVLVLLLLLSVLPVAQAYSVERVWLEWNGHTVRAISPTESLPSAVVKIKLSNDTQECFPGGSLNSCTLLLRAGNIASPGDVARMNDTSIAINTCQRNSTGVFCTTQPFTFSTRSPSNIVQHSLRIGAGGSGWSTSTISVTLDTTRPRLSGLTVGHCEGDRCYASTVYPTPFTVTFDDNQTSFAFKQVYVGRQLQPVFAIPQNCTSRTCDGEIRVPCRNDGDQQSVELVLAQGQPSREDSQNPVEGQISRTVICTSDSPRFIEPFNMTVAGSLPVPAVGGSVTYRVQVQSPHGRPTAVLNTERINGVRESTANCQQDTTDSQKYSCTWQIANLREGTHDLAFTISDRTGNRDMRNRASLRVYNITTPANNRTDLFTIQRGEVIPDRINRLALDLAAGNYLPYPAYVTYTLEPRRQGNVVIRQELDRCWYKLPNETNYSNSNRYNLFSRDRGESRVLYPGRDHTSANRLNLQIRANRDVLALSDKFDVTCQLRLIAGDATGVYGTPEFENLTFEIGLRESPLGQPGQAFVEEIKREQEKLNGSAMEFITTLRTVRSTLDGVCQVMDGLQGLDVTGTSLETAGQTLISTGVGAVGGGPIKSAGDSIQKIVNPLLKNLWYNKEGTLGSQGQERFLRKVCKQVTCQGAGEKRQENTEQLTAQVGTADPSVRSFFTRELTKNLNEPDYSKSMIASIQDMCIGGIIYNAGKWQDINCGRLMCLKEQSINAGSIAVCDAARDTKVCMQLTGEVFESIGVLRQYKNVANNLDGLIQNAPGFMASFFQNRLCQGTDERICSPAEWTCTGCHITKAIVHTVDYAQQTNQQFRISQPDSGICLEAMCNADDPNCPRSYNRIEQYSRYAQYLQVNAWLRNEQAKKVATTERSAWAQLDSQYNDWCNSHRDYCDVTRGYHITREEGPGGTEYFLQGNQLQEGGYERRSVVTDESLRATLSQVPDQEYLNAANFPAYREMVRQGIPPANDAEYDEYQTRIQILGSDGEGVARAQAIVRYEQCRETACSQLTSYRTALAENGVAVTDQGYRLVNDPANANDDTLIPRSEAASASKIITSQHYWNTFDTVANIAVKWAYDEGYLNFLSVSAAGAWGQELSRQSRQYISVEGQRQTFCSDLFEFNEDDEGVILEPSADQFTRVAGTFAAEVREITNESGTSYAYVYTIYVSNPTRPVTPGQANPNYDFRMDAVFDQPDCTNCERQFDLIDGRFKLDEGVNFANGNGPRRGIIYLPDRYTRFCITFDKAFPGLGGRTSYCREIKENVYATGSPYVTPSRGPNGQNPGSTGSTAPGNTGTGSTGTQTDPDGSGRLIGEI